MRRRTSSQTIIDADAPGATEFVATFRCIQDAKMSSNAKKVLCYILHCHRLSQPARTRIAVGMEYLNMSRTRYYDAVKVLEETGLVYRVKIPGRTQRAYMPAAEAAEILSDASAGKWTEEESLRLLRADGRSRVSARSAERVKGTPHRKALAACISASIKPLAPGEQMKVERAWKRLLDVARAKDVVHAWKRYMAQLRREGAERFAKRLLKWLEDPDFVQKQIAEAKKATSISSARGFSRAAMEKRKSLMRAISGENAAAKELLETYERLWAPVLAELAQVEDKDFEAELDYLYEMLERGYADRFAGHADFAQTRDAIALERLWRLAVDEVFFPEETDELEWEHVSPRLALARAYYAVPEGITQADEVLEWVSALECREADADIDALAEKLQAA